MEPGVDTTVKADRIQVRAKAYSATNEPVTEMVFLVNGRQVEPRWWQNVGRPSASYSGRYAEISATLPLPEAVNRISVVAKNRFNTAEPQTIEVRRQGDRASSNAFSVRTFTCFQSGFRITVARSFRSYCMRTKTQKPLLKRFESRKANCTVRPSFVR